MTDNVIDSRLTKLAWMAMDQTYQNVEVGMSLASPNNGTSAPVTSNTTPWAIPNNGFVVSSVIQGENGGKFVIYTNAETKEIMVSAMGTNGSNDTLGWATNFKDRGYSQITGNSAIWENADVWKTLSSAIQQSVSEIGGTSQVASLSFVGDSKGGAQAQMLLAMYVSSRESDSEGLFVANAQLNLIAHSAPGVEDIIASKIDASLDLTGINFQYSYASTALASTGEGSSVPTYATDIVSQLGSSYLGQGLGTCKIYGYPASTTDSSAGYVHRLVGSGLDYVNSLGGADMFSGLSSQTSKPSIISGTALAYLSDYIDLNKIVGAPSASAAESELARQIQGAVPILVKAGLIDAISGNFTLHSVFSALGAIVLASSPYGILAGLGMSLFSNKAASDIASDAKASSMTYNEDGTPLAYNGYTYTSAQLADDKLVSTTWKKGEDSVTFTKDAFTYHSNLGDASFSNGMFSYTKIGSDKPIVVSGVGYAAVGEDGLITLYNAQEGKIGTANVKTGEFNLLENEQLTSVRRDGTALSFTCGNETYSFSNWFTPSSDPSIPGYTPTLDISLTLGNGWSTSAINKAAMVSDYSDSHSAVTVEGVTGFSATITGSHYGDTLTGKGPKDILNGGAGADYLTSEGGQATMTGGTGDDHLISNNILGDTFVYNKGDGNDVITLSPTGTSKLVLGGDLAGDNIRLVKTMGGLDVQILDDATGVLNTIKIAGWHGAADTFSIVLPNGSTKTASDIQDSFKETVKVPVGADDILPRYGEATSMGGWIKDMFPDVALIDAVYEQNPYTHNPLARPETRDWLLSWPLGNYTLGESLVSARSHIRTGEWQHLGISYRDAIGESGTKFSFFEIASGIMGGYISGENPESLQHQYVRYEFGEEFSNNPWYNLQFVGWKDANGDACIKLIGAHGGIWGREPGDPNDLSQGLPSTPTQTLWGWGLENLRTVTLEDLLSYVHYADRETSGLSSVIFGDETQFTDMPLTINPTRTVEGKFEWTADVISNATQYVDAAAEGTVKINNDRSELSLTREGNDLVVSDAHNGQVVVLNAFNYSKPGLNFTFGTGENKETISYQYALADSGLTSLQKSGDAHDFWSNVQLSEVGGIVSWDVSSALSSLSSYSSTQLANILSNSSAIGIPDQAIIPHLTDGITSVTKADSGVVYGSAANDSLSGVGVATVVGGKGNDALHGDENATVYEFFKGDGQDTISDAGGADKLRIHTEWDKVMMREEGDNLIIYFLNGKDQITVQNWKTTGVLESLEFTDKTVTANSTEFQSRLQVLNGNPGYTISSHSLYTVGGEEGGCVDGGQFSYFNLGKGDDMAILAGNSVYVFNKGDGNDRIDIRDENHITIRLGEGIVREDISVTLGEEGFYVLKIGESDSITIADVNMYGNPVPREHILFPCIELHSGEMLTAADFASQFNPILREDGTWVVKHTDFLPPSPANGVSFWEVQAGDSVGLLFQNFADETFLKVNGSVVVSGSLPSEKNIYIQGVADGSISLRGGTPLSLDSSMIAQGGSNADSFGISPWGSPAIPTPETGPVLLTGGGGDDGFRGISGIFAGEAGNDTYLLKKSIALFNKGDGVDRLYVAEKGVISLGGFVPSELTISSQEHLTTISAGDDQISWLKAWNIEDNALVSPILQIFSESGDVLEIDMGAAGAYAQEHGSFNLSDHLQDFLVSSSTTEAYGGGLAAYYAEHGNFTGLGIQDTWDLLKTLDPMQKQTVTQPLPSTDALKLI